MSAPLVKEQDGIFGKDDVGMLAYLEPSCVLLPQPGRYVWDSAGAKFVSSFSACVSLSYTSHKYHAGIRNMSAPAVVVFGEFSKWGQTQAVIIAQMAQGPHQCC